MKETPIVLYEEVPVPEPDLFLLYSTNRAFIKRKIERPFGVDNTEYIGKTIPGLIATLICLGVVFSTLEMKVNPIFLVVVGVLLPIVLIFTFGKADDTYPMAGWILTGEIVASELVKMRFRHYAAEKFVIDYRFTTPQGDVCEGFAIGLIDDANYKTPPPVGTPIRIWYPDKGPHSLL